MENFKWDKWQKELIEYEGSCTIRKGRQVGCSTAAGKRIKDLMIKYVGSHHLIIGPAQRQSGELYLKVLSWLEVTHQEVLAKTGGYKSNPNFSTKKNMDMKRRFEYDHGIYNELPTKTTIRLKKDFSKLQGIKNEGTVLYALPAGKTGVYLRTFALDFLHIDEAPYVPEAVYTALKPMLLVSKKMRGLGWEMFVGTPFGKGGFFYNSHHSDDYRKWHISSENCKRIDPKDLRKEKERLTKAMYLQEWCGEFIDEWNQFFPTKLIKKCMEQLMIWEKAKDYRKEARYYLGMDIARYGGDENAFVVVEELNHNLRAVKCITTERVSTTDTIGRAKVIDSEFKFNKLLIDSGGLGGSVTDQLEESLGKRRVVGLDNAKKRIQVEGEEKKKGILKEDLYSFTLKMMETGKLELINDLKLLRSMKSITFEYTADKNLKIFGDYSHLTEALVRACWGMKEKGLNIYIY